MMSSVALGEQAWQALIVLGVAALPLSELRGAIPLALISFGFPPLVAYALGVVGNLLPVLPLLLGLEALLKVLERWPWPWGQPLRRPLSWWLRLTERRFRGAVERFGPWALIVIVAVPLPMTGAWTGCAVAVLFRVPLAKALVAIALGVLAAGAIVTLATLGALGTLAL